MEYKYIGVRSETLQVFPKSALPLEDTSITLEKMWIGPTQNGIEWILEIEWHYEAVGRVIYRSIDSYAIYRLDPVADAKDGVRDLIYDAYNKLIERYNAYRTQSTVGMPSFTYPLAKSEVMDFVSKCIPRLSEIIKKK